MDFKVKDKCYKIFFLILSFYLGICKLSSWFVGRQSTGKTSVHTVCAKWTINNPACSVPLPKNGI